MEDSVLTVEAPGVLENDTDPDGDSLTASLVSGVSSGSLTLDANGAFEYVPDAGFTGTDQFTYEASDGSAADTAAVAIQVGGDLSVRSIQLTGGWNLVSVPLEAPDPSFGAVLFPCESGFFFDPGSGYQSIGGGEAVPVGRGLFANCSAGTVEVTGSVPDSSIVPVAQGWNIIGPLADSVDVGSITSDPPGLVQSSFFGFDPVAGYVEGSTLGPGVGYWVNASEAGTLDLSGSGGGEAALATTQSQAKVGHKSGVELQISDAAGREATLRLTSDLTEAQRKQSALPPRPPGGIFDVRFKGGQAVAEVGEGALQPIETQGLEGPVTVQLVGGAEKGQGVQIRHAGSKTRLTAESPSAELSATEGLAAGLQGAPEEFALEKPYPNPSSGQATLEYALPERADVSIAVYDVLGRQVATLANGQAKAGRHTAVLEADQLSSGTYFVRMQSEHFRQTRRVTVVR